MTKFHNDKDIEAFRRREWSPADLVFFQERAAAFLPDSMRGRGQGRFGYWTLAGMRADFVLELQWAIFESEKRGKK